MVFVVLALVFLALLFGSLHAYSRHLRSMSVDVVGETITGAVAAAVAEPFWSFLEESFRTRSGCSKLFPNEGGDSPFNLADGRSMDGLILEPGDLDRRADLEQVIAKICGRLPELSDLRMRAVFAVVKRQPAFQQGFVNLEVRFAWRKKTYFWVSRRPFVHKCFLPLIPAKFTLFVRSCDDPEMFNIKEKRFQEDSGPQECLLLWHSMRPFVPSALETWRESGWVYLGGPRIFLNLDGTHPSRRESETFLFWPRLYFGASPNAELPYACSPYLGSSRLRVRFTPIGAMKEWTSSEPLKRVVGAGAAARMERSSVLRLYGNKTKISPTRVIGNVLARFFLYATMIYDENGDSVADTVGSHKLVFPLPRLTRASLYLPPLSPHLVSASGYDLFLNPAGLSGIPTGLTDLMPTYSSGAANDYVTFMTKLSFDFSRASGFAAYNALYDSLFDQTLEGQMRTFPSRHVFRHEAGGSEYPNDGHAFILPRSAQDDRPRLQTDLTGFNPASGFASIEDGWVYQVPNTEQLLRLSVVQPTQNGWRFVKPAIIHIQGDLMATERFVMDAPVVLVVDGDVVLHSIRRGTAAGRMVIIARRKSIRVVSGDAEALLVAPEGTVLWDNRLAISGGLCVKWVDPQHIARYGGTILYDQGLDPMIPENLLRNHMIVLGRPCFLQEMEQ